MFNFIKNALGFKKELTDKELVDLWNKSGKNAYDFEKFILKIKNNFEGIALREISNINFQNFNDVKDFLGVMSKNNKQNSNVSLSASKNRKKLHYLIEQIIFINNLYVNKIIDDDKLLNYLFASKYEIFSYLLKYYNDTKQQNEKLKEILYQTYFKKEIYLPLMEYFLDKNSKEEVEFFLPSNSNVDIIINNSSIPNTISFDKYFTNKEPSDAVNGLWLYLIIYFFEKDKIFKNLNNFYPKNDFTKVETLLFFYNLLISIPNNKVSFNDFLNDLESSEKYFKNITVIETSIKFNSVIDNIVKIVKSNYKTFLPIQFLLLNILKSLLISKSKIDYITYTAQQICNLKLYDKKAIQQIILKYLFENYSDNLAGLNQFLKIVTQLINVNILTVPNLKEELEKIIEFSTILDNGNVSCSLNDIMKNQNYYNKFKQRLIIDYLYSKANNFKLDQFDFIDTNIKEILSLINFYNYHNNEKKTVGYFLINFFNYYTGFACYILDILLANNALVLTQEEENELINKFIQNPQNLKQYESIEKFINQFSNRADSSMIIELDKILTYLNIQKMFSSYQINLNYLEDINYQNYLDKIDQLLEVYLINGVKVDQISSINDFLQKRPSQDIQKSLKLSTIDYLYHLFSFFLKYKKEPLFSEILSMLNNNKKKDLLIKCINMVYDNYFNKNKEKFAEFIEKNNLKIFLIENSNFYLENLEDMRESKEAAKYLKCSLLLDKNTELLNTFAILKHDEEKFIKNSSLKTQIDIMNEFSQSKSKKLSDLLLLYENKNNDAISEGVNYKYSLHPKLIGLLNQKKVWNFVKNIKINFESKIKIYNFILNKKICEIKDINDFESLSFTISQKSASIVNVLKFYFNLYNEQNRKVIDTYLPKDYLLKINGNEIMKNEVIYGLIDFNLGNLKYISYENLLFLNKFFGFNIGETDEASTLLYSLLSKMCNKLTILPFLNSFSSEIYPKYKTIIDRYYNDSSLLNGNSKYFLKLCQNQVIKFQIYEIFKSINMNNWANFKKLFEIKEYDQVSKKILFIFIYKLTISYLSLSSVIDVDTNYGCDSIIRMILLFDLSNEEMLQLCNDILYYPQLTYILESTQNILILDGKVAKMIKSYSNAKKILFEEIQKMYPDITNVSKNPVLYNTLKLFNIKHHIFKSIPSSETKQMYNKIRQSEDFNEIYNELSNYKTIKDDIYNIYTQY